VTEADIKRRTALPQPLVTVVLPTHNRPALLAEAVASVCAQTYTNWELIVVDDASSPSVSTAVPPEYRAKVRCIRHPQSQGGAAGKNTGIAAGRGELFAFIDDDDLYEPRYLERAVAVLDRYRQVDVLFMGVGWFGSGARWGEQAHGESTARLLAEAKPHLLDDDVSLFDERFLGALLKRVPMAFQRPVVRRAALDRIGHYRADCLLWDCEWALRASLAATCAYLKQPLYQQRLDGQGYSSRDDRELDHLKSGLDMTWQLYVRPPFEIPSGARGLLCEAAGNASLSIARHHAMRRRVVPALRAWAHSRTVCRSVGGLRALASVLLALTRSIGAAQPRTSL
jgi:glycosyltransferase involved in cell wall biosynthesis